MNWISVEDRLPPVQENNIIVAIMNSRLECHGDPIEDAKIVILRYSCGEWRTMDACRIYYLPKDDQNPYDTINYWVAWQEFPFPESMLSISK